MPVRGVNNFTYEVWDLLLKSQRVTGEQRPEHTRRWVSALHVLTERLVGERIEMVSSGDPHHSAYHRVADAVLTLEKEGIISVQRRGYHLSCKANQVEAIQLL